MNDSKKKSPEISEAGERENATGTPWEPDESAPLSPMGTEGCQWDEYYPHLEDWDDSEEAKSKGDAGKVVP